MMSKKIFPLILKFLLLGYCAAVVLVACSSDEEATQEPVNGDEATENASEDATETATTDADETMTDDNSAEDVIAEAEAIVNEDEPTSATESIPAVPFAEATGTEPTPAVVDTKLNPTESREHGKTAESAPVAVPVQNDSDAESASGPLESATGRVVRYVRPTKLNIRQAASESAPSVGSLHRGDIVLVSYEGNWARLDNGTYLDGHKLSSKGLGHERKPRGWRSQK